ncbi:MAG: hypothetical protein K6A90_12780 [Lachnospiraceae bacterium]|nr:hypothetical protein [Lachnospiraceae bacterium]
MKNSYVNLLIESLEDKIKVLDEIIKTDAEQANILKEPEVDLDELRESQEKIGELAEKLDKLNDGFESVYSKVRDELQNNKDLYRDEIKKMQELITIITDKSVKVEAEQSRNKSSAGKFFKDKRKELSDRRNAVQKINLYANQMHSVIPKGQADAAFLDKKK